MRKSTLFVSVVLTTFMLAVLFGVVSAYKNIVSTAETAVEPQPAAMAEVVNQPVAAVVPTQIVPAQAAVIAPEEAAAIAGKVLGRSDLYSVEVTQFEGADAYLVTFSSRDLVYLSLDGRVLSISKLPVTVVTQRRGGSNEDENTGGTTAVVTNTGEDHENEGEEHESEGGDD